MLFLSNYLNIYILLKKTGKTISLKVGIFMP